MAIGALDAAGLLKQLAVALSDAIPSDEIVAAIIGIASALIDNVPLVAATMGMYDLAQYPQDAPLWQLIAYCAGTGGSILVIGSASGVALMGLEQVRSLRCCAARRRRGSARAATACGAATAAFALR
jgi:Na+/H+ antiporter NhaD/arsenite permease-like protein